MGGLHLFPVCPGEDAAVSETAAAGIGDLECSKEGLVSSPSCASSYS